MTKLKGGEAGSITAIRQQIASGENYLQRIPADNSIRVRFMTEPSKWFQFFEHYDEVLRFFPCQDGDCPGCDEGNRASKRYLANVVILSDGDPKTVPLVVPSTLVPRLLTRHDRYKTLMDREYELMRLGSGLKDTQYDIEVEPKSEFNFKKFKLLDLEEVLQKQLDQALQISNKDDEETPSKRRLKEDPVDELDGDDDTDGVSREVLETWALRKLKDYARDECGIDSEDLRGQDKPTVIEMILEADQDDDDEGDQDDDDTWSKEDIEALTEEDLPEAKALCRELEVKIRPSDDIEKIKAKLLDYYDIPF